MSPWALCPFFNNRKGAYFICIFRSRTLFSGLSSISVTYRIPLFLLTEFHEASSLVNFWPEWQGGVVQRKWQLGKKLAYFWGISAFLFRLCFRKNSTKIFIEKAFPSFDRHRRKYLPRLWSPSVSSRLGINCLPLQFVIERSSAGASLLLQKSSRGLLVVCHVLRSQIFWMRLGSCILSSCSVLLCCLVFGFVFLCFSCALRFIVRTISSKSLKRAVHVLHNVNYRIVIFECYFMSSPVFLWTWVM